MGRRVTAIPIIDIFAGPGGLGEGFAALRTSSRKAYRSALSIEKDPAAHRTLMLRAFFRQFPDAKAPDAYYACLSGRLTMDELYQAHPVQHAAATGEAWCAELGTVSKQEVRDRIGAALGGADPWVLLGGPPCQPFSLAGRSRNRANTRYSDGKETRHELYTEYLQIIADFWPAVFVMENVRGLLSAKFNGQRMFHRITQDLQRPADAIVEIPDRERRKTGRNHTYTLHALNAPVTGQSLYDNPDYLIRCENHGIPQARHRLILIGVRDDLPATPRPLDRAEPIPASVVFEGLPPIRKVTCVMESVASSWPHGRAA